MTDIPNELIGIGFGGMAAAVGLLWRHFAQQTKQVRIDLKERITALEKALEKALLELKELRHYERDRLFSLADQAHDRERAYKAWMRRLARCAHCPADQTEIDTEALTRTTEPPPPRGSSSSFQPVIDHETP